MRCYNCKKKLDFFIYFEFKHGCQIDDRFKISKSFCSVECLLSFIEDIDQTETGELKNLRSLTEEICQNPDCGNVTDDYIVINKNSRAKGNKKFFCCINCLRKYLKPSRKLENIFDFDEISFTINEFKKAFYEIYPEIKDNKKRINKIIRNLLEK